MAKRKQEDAAMLKAKAGPRSGLVKVAVYLTPEQLVALQGLAKSRAEERGALRPDVSEATRHVLSGWLGRRK